MKVSINDKCIMCGACSSVNSDVFEIKGDHIHVHQENAEKFQDDCMVASEACPVDAIEIE